jgi:hypothetical protein
VARHSILAGLEPDSLHSKGSIGLAANTTSYFKTAPIAQCQHCFSAKTGELPFEERSPDTTWFPFPFWQKQAPIVALLAAPLICGLVLYASR